MRLLNTNTVKLEDFGLEDRPRYAILSHRWGNDEVTLQDLESGGAAKKAGFEKILRCCDKAKKDGFAYAWIDTCCIDKTSSAELSEAINSMYEWYFDAGRCYAYLADVPTSKATVQESEWFERGFTLQELLAPAELCFLDYQWNEIGTKKSLQKEVTARTGIPPDILSGFADIDTASIAQRMSWAASRKTSRLEDRAYCLMGIFGVNMPLIYGEGERAFTRLQEEILKISDDQSIFAWESSDSRTGLLATSPSAFARSMNIVPLIGPDNSSSQLTVTSRGIYMDIQFIGTSPQRVGLAILHCVEGGVENERIGIHVRDLFWTMQSFERVLSSSLGRIRPETLASPSISDRVSLRRVCIQTKRISTTRNLLANRQANNGLGYETTSLELNHPYSISAALHNAVAEGDSGVVWLLLSRCAIDVNHVDAEGRTLLRRAVELGRETIVMMLLQQDGIDVESRNELDQGVLLLAVSEGHEAIVKLLLERGVEVNAEDEAESTPLRVAAQTGKRALALALLDRGAAKDIQDSSGRTPLWVAADSGQREVVELLLGRQAAKNVRDKTGQTALARACSKGHVEVVRLFLRHHADINLADNGGHTPLWKVVEQGDAATMQSLLKNGAINFDAKCIHDLTPLWVAASHCRQDLIKLLISHGADVNLPDNQGQTPLWKAVEQSDAATMQLLLKNGAIDVDAKCKHQLTPLWVAASHCRQDLIKLLISHGADVNLPDNQGQTPLWKAVEQSDAATMQLLLKNGAIDVDAKCKHELTPLWLVASNGRQDLVELLIRHGADIQVRDTENRTLLWYAVAKDQVEVVQSLLESGRFSAADVNARNNMGWTPLAIALIRHNQHSRRMVELLIHHGADVCDKDIYGKTPLDHAAQFGNRALVKIIKESSPATGSRIARTRQGLKSVANFLS